jgi:hypothetical protein
MIRGTKPAIVIRAAGLGLALALALIWGGPVAQADEPHRHGEMYGRDWRDHGHRDHDEGRRRWERHREAPPVVVAPETYYAPPPVVVAPPPGLNIVIPLNLR